MGADTHLYLSKRWGLDDIKTVIERTQDTKVEVESRGNMAIDYFNFSFKVGSSERMMHVHADAALPTGPVTLLSLSHNPQAIKVMRAIAECLGGLLEENDYDSMAEVIRGKFDDEDGLQYFLKYAIVHDGIEHDDERGFRGSMAAWHEEMGS